MHALSFKASYKNWDFDLLLNGVQGVDAFNTNIFFLQNQENVSNQGVEVLRRFQFEGDVLGQTLTIPYLLAILKMPLIYV